MCSDVDISKFPCYQERAGSTCLSRGQPTEDMCARCQWYRQRDEEGWAEMNEKAEHVCDMRVVLELLECTCGAQQARNLAYGEGRRP